MKHCSSFRQISCSTFLQELTFLEDKQNTGTGRFSSLAKYFLMFLVEEIIISISCRSCLLCQVTSIQRESSKFNMLKGCLQVPLTGKAQEISAYEKYVAPRP